MLRPLENPIRPRELSKWPKHWHDLVLEVVQNFELDIDGIHGVSHWTRVLENGFRLAETNGANLKVVTAFARLHDSRRENDGYDPEHGFRGAEYGWHLRQQMPTFSDIEFEAGTPSFLFISWSSRIFCKFSGRASLLRRKVCNA